MSRRSHRRSSRRNRRPDYDYTGSPNPKNFRRSRSDRVIAGICGGLADRFGWDPLMVRLIAVALLFFTGFGPIMITYLVVWMLTPSRRTDRPHMTPEEDAFWRGVSDRPTATFSNMKYTFRDLEDRLRNLERNVTSEEWRLRKEFRDLEGN
ncbi:MAG: envelope stress response membrane protein PspC [Hyphomonadaceae bacterium]